MAENKDNVKIHVSHLKKNFGKLEVLKDVSIDIHEGEVVVILGPSGSGKSTFLRCLNRLEEITGGTVVVDGYNITDKRTDINKVRENVGMVFQLFNLFNNLDVMGNMILAPTELKKAFVIGFYLYIPFLLIDVVVASALMSMGMIMLPPSMISMPFKLLLFIALDGWQLLFSTLVRSFQ